MGNNKYVWEENNEILKRIVDEEQEELLSKKRARELFEKNLLEKIEIGTIEGLQEIHRYLFQDCYETAGMIRKHDISKGETIFCRIMYLNDNLKTVSRMSEDTFEQIIEKYVEMNMMHPFYEGNGRAMRIWLDQILIKNLKKCINWKNINRSEYMSAMKRSIVNNLELRFLLKENLTDKIQDRDVFMNGINQSYKYENMAKYDINSIEE